MKVITKQALREFRKRRDMTQVEMSEHMGVSVSCIRSWEQDANPRKVPKRLLSDPRMKELITNKKG